MPNGLLIFKWDDRVGTSILARYPEELNFNEKTMMQIYSTHEYSGESGLISMNVGSLNLASYYASDAGLYLVMVLEIDEDPEAFEDGLSDAARLISSNIENKAYDALIPSIFQRLTVYPTLNDERKLAMIYTDDAKRMVFKRLQEEGSLLKSEISIWLKDQFRDGFVDVEALIQSLLKASLVRSRSVKGSPSDVIYLVNDLFVTRSPPIRLVKESTERGLPIGLMENYRNEVTGFFSDYEITEEDNIKLLNTLLDPPVYETITLMRESIVTRDDLEKLQKKGVDDVDDVLKKLWDAEIVIVLRDQGGNEYYALKSDVNVMTIFPEYNLNLIRKQFDSKIKSNQVQLDYIKALKDQFNSKQSPKKKSKKREVSEIS